MSTKRPSRSPEDIARMIGGLPQVIPTPVTEPRKSRSKRQLPKELSSQICFRIETERHQKLRVHCVSNGIEIGEFMDSLLKEKGF